MVLLPLSLNLLVAGIALLLFIVGYYLYYPPYRALYADLRPRTLYAGSQASQGILRGAGLGLRLLPGGLLPGLWEPLQFVALAGSVLLTLPQALAFLVAPEGAEGIAAGVVDVSRGVGVVLGPLAVG